MDHKQKDIKNFLDVLLDGFEKAENETNTFEVEFSGKKHPETIVHLGEAISLLYKSACCYWKCNGGDHVIERLIAKSVNQAISAYKLYKGCFYDESLMITRGIGEIVNLLHLFYFFPEKMNQWVSLDSKERYKYFKPASVRQFLENENKLVPIDKERYGKLCEVGTHPTPSETPGHYSGTGVPILGMIVQPAGAYVSIVELSYAIGLVCVVTPKLLNLEDKIAKEFKETGISLIENLGNFHILNYHERLAKAWEKQDKRKKE